MSGAGREEAEWCRWPEDRPRVDPDSADTCLRACVNGYAGVHHTKGVNHEERFQKVESAQHCSSSIDMYNNDVGKKFMK
jgi:hypothetical protein